MQDPIVVTGANGLVGSAVVNALTERGATVRAVVRRAGTAPRQELAQELVGEFQNPDFAASVCRGAGTVINTVYPMADESEERESPRWAADFARAARDAGAGLFIQVSSTAVYEREGHSADVDESSPLVDDSANSYAVTKRQADEEVEAVDGITRVLVRPTAILGPGDTSVWNTLRPEAIRTTETARTDDPDRSFGWVHISDLAALIADLATGAIAPSSGPAKGPVPGAATAVNAVSGTVPLRAYIEPIAHAVGVDPVWERRDGFRSQLLAERARAWGWVPATSFDSAMAELLGGLR